MKISALVSTKEQLNAVLRSGSAVSRVILDSTVCAPEEWADVGARIRDAGKEAFFAFPYVFQEKARQYFLKAMPMLQKAAFSGFLLRSLEEFVFAKEQGLNGLFQADHGIYAFNREAKNVLLSGGFDLLTVPLEHSFKDSARMGAQSMELIVYGYIPMMVSHNCVHATLEGCDHRGKPLLIVDRLSHGMRHMNDCRFCLSTIYNCVPLYLLDCQKEIDMVSPDSLRLSFTFESEETCESILRLSEDSLIGARSGNQAPSYDMGEFTRGHFRNSVE